MGSTLTDPILPNHAGLVKVVFANPLVLPDTTPAVTLFNGGVSLVYIDSTGSDYFYAAFASH
jgi:hypothetical protein